MNLDEHLENQANERSEFSDLSPEVIEKIDLAESCGLAYGGMDDEGGGPMFIGTDKEFALYQAKLDEYDQQ